MFDKCTKKLILTGKNERTQKMKKRILAMILAALLTASMASCWAEGNNENPVGGTEETQTQAPNDPNPDNPVTNVWQDANYSVYVVSPNLNLTQVSDASKTVKVPLMTKLFCKKTSSTKSIVEYEGVEYYATSEYLSAEDLLGEKFNPCNPAVTMYATTGLQVRKYAIVDSISSTTAQLTSGEAVKVVAMGDASGMTWCKIEYEIDGETGTYFVSKKYLSDTQGTPGIDQDYEKYFEACAKTTMYVTVEYVNVRKAPIDGEYVTTAVKDSAWTVVALGTGDYEKWCMVEVEREVKEGDPKEYDYYYISLTCLSTVPESASQDLTQVLAKYPNFDPCDKTMYVAEDNLNVRLTPELGDNYAGALVRGNAVKVVAMGKDANNSKWAMIEVQKTADDNTTYTVYQFVSAICLSVNANGAPDLDKMMAEYGDKYETVTEKTLVATQVANCYYTPNTSNTVPYKLEAGAQVTLVAQAKSGGNATWCIIMLEDGSCYFAPSAYFTESTPAA